jgi:hypothetical protein
LAYSVEKLCERGRLKIPIALESLKFLRAEGTGVSDDLRAQIRSVRYASRFPRIFGRISIQLKNRFDPGKEFFNRIGRELPDSSPKTGRSTSAARGFSGSLLVLSGFARLVVVEYRRFLPRPR